MPRWYEQSVSGKPITFMHLCSSSKVRGNEGSYMHKILYASARKYHKSISISLSTTHIVNFNTHGVSRVITYLWFLGHQLEIKKSCTAFQLVMDPSQGREMYGIAIAIFCGKLSTSLVIPVFYSSVPFHHSIPLILNSCGSANLLSTGNFVTWFWWLLKSSLSGVTLAVYSFCEAVLTSKGWN